MFDEYHYGFGGECQKELFGTEDDKKRKYICSKEGIEYLMKILYQLQQKAYLYLSGTPFRAIESANL